MDPKTKIFILATGGTIEKGYNELDGSLLNRGSLLEEQVLSKLRLSHTPYELEVLMSKDSLDMTEMDRSLICDKALKIAAFENQPVVIIHGTDTLTETAQQCLTSSQTLKSPIIFTGAMKPPGFADSDAEQNVCEALLAARLLSPGVYVCFHNIVMNAAEAVKDRKKGTFVKKTGA